MLENFDVIDFLPKNEFLETQVECDHLVLGSGTEISVAFPESVHGLGLVLHPDIIGLSPLVDDTIFQIAARGIPTIAIEPFTKLQNIVKLSREEKLQRICELDDVEQCGDLLGAAQILKSKHGCTKVALIGFCIGGMYAFKCAGTGIFDAVVSCYGMINLPEHWKSETQREPLDYLSMDTASPVLAIIGGQDKEYAKINDVNKLIKLFEDEHHTNLGSEIKIFDNAGHAFMHNPSRSEYRQADAKLAWKIAFDFISEKTSLRI
ncbi:MAG: dienelactone hydrolase family protein [Acidimicrobiia bacterium]|nr:dienelactone hydrolase family protein [Acidimicrobiia bacterium]